MRLERHGIIQCGKGLKVFNNVPAFLYDQLELEPPKHLFLFNQVSSYIDSVRTSSEYVQSNPVFCTTFEPNPTCAKNGGVKKTGVYCK